MNTKRRRTWLATGIVVIVLIAGVALLVRNAGGSTSDAASCRLAVPSAAGTAGNASRVDVVEQGHSLVIGESPWASMGAVLRNVTDHVAYRTEVTSDALDAGGRNLVWTNHQLFKTQMVPVAPAAERERRAVPAQG